jgi:hypothetical protein
MHKFFEGEIKNGLIFVIYIRKNTIDDMPVLRRGNIQIANFEGILLSDKQTTVLNR